MSKAVCRQVRIWLLLCIIFRIGVLFPARAEADSPVIDMNRLGSLTISYREADDGNDPVPGAIFELYRIAVPEQQVSGYSVGFGYRPLLCDASGKKIPVDAATSAGKVKEAALRVYAAAAKGKKSSLGNEGMHCSVKTDVNGNAVADKLAPGVYLVLESKAAKAHLPTAPFLITVPYTYTFTRNGSKYMAWKYSAASCPKPVPCGELLIAKYVQGPGAGRSGRFHFRVELGRDGSFHYKKSDGREGRIRSGGTISLKGGQSVRIDTIPEGTQYRVWEEEANKGGFVTQARGASGRISRRKAAAAMFLNQALFGKKITVAPTMTPAVSVSRGTAAAETARTAPVKTGDTNLVWPWMLLAGGSMLVIAAATAGKRPQRKSSRSRTENGIQGNDAKGCAARIKERGHSYVQRKNNTAGKQEKDSKI